MSQLRAVVILVLSVLMNFAYSGQSLANEFIDIPCTVKECNPKLGDTLTRWFKGKKNKPAIIWYAGGKGTSMNIDYQPISNLRDEFDIIMVASPLAISSNNSKGFPYNAYHESVVFRMRQVSEYYKKKLNKPIWLGGISSGGPRMIGLLAGDEKDRQSDNYAGLIFASPYIANGNGEMNISDYRIKYKMNLPILIIQHARDLKPAQHPRLQKMFQERLAKNNSNKTELMLLTEGLSTTTNFDGGHHWFLTNREEVARVVSKFILDNTK